MSAGVSRAQAPIGPLPDFNADGKGDLLLRNKATGQNIGWLMNGLTVSSLSRIPADDRRHELGDQRRRRLRRRRQSRRHLAEQSDRSEHRLADERADGRRPPRSCRRLPTPTGRSQGVGDFDGDGKADVIWRNMSTGQNIGWLMNGLTVATRGFLPTIADTQLGDRGRRRLRRRRQGGRHLAQQGHRPEHRLADERVDRRRCRRSCRRLPTRTGRSKAWATSTATARPT